MRLLNLLGYLMVIAGGYFIAATEWQQIVGIGLLALGSNVVGTISGAKSNEWRPDKHEL